MAKVIGPLFSMQVSGALGEIVFDRRGFVRLKGHIPNRRTASQGDFRQTMAAAQKCAQVCGSTTRQLVRNLADDPARWSAYLVKNLIGPDRANYRDNMQRFAGPTVDQPAWEAAAVEAGMRPVHLNYAGEAEISPGAQLFMLALTLFSLGLYRTLGQPDGNAGAWKERVIS
jgi:hypothetical protein